MLMMCKTSRGRIACGLGGGLIALSALAIVWTLSPKVSAGDEPPAPGEGKGVRPAAPPSDPARGRHSSVSRGRPAASFATRDSPAGSDRGGWSCEFYSNAARTAGGYS